MAIYMAIYGLCMVVNITLDHGLDRWHVAPVNLSGWMGFMSWMGFMGMGLVAGWDLCPALCVDRIESRERRARGEQKAMSHDEAVRKIPGLWSRPGSICSYFSMDVRQKIDNVAIVFDRCFMRLRSLSTLHDSGSYGWPTQTRSNFLTSNFQ